MTTLHGAPAQAFPLVRHLSCRVSRILTRTAITPNQVTGAALATGLASNALLATGGRTETVAAALLFVVSYVLDHADGELARAKRLTSDFGDRFDTFVDWIVNAGFFACLGVGVAARTGESLWLLLGLAGGVGATINYVLKLVLDGIPEAPQQAPAAPGASARHDIWDRILTIFRDVIRSDFCFIVFVLALVDGLWLLLPAGAIGAQVYWMTAPIQRLRRDPRLARFAAPAKRLIALATGLGLLALVLVQTDMDEVWTGVTALGAAGAAVVIAVYLVAFVVDTASWQLMLPSVRLGPAWLYRLWRIRMIGEALNVVLPAGSLGGEPIKAVLLKKLYDVGYREGGASLIIARTVNLLALVAFSAIGFALMFRAEGSAGPYRLLAGLGLGALAIGIFGFYAVQRWRAASRLAGWLAVRRAGRVLVDVLAHIQDIDDRFAAFYGRQPGRFSAALALAFANWLLGAAEIYAIMWFLDQPVTWREAWLIETVAQLVRAGAFFIPGGLGAIEGAMAIVYDALTGRPALGLAVALIRRGRELLWIAWGFWFGWRFSLETGLAIARLRERE